MAADLPSRAAAPAPAPVATSSWDGFYVGASVAHSLGNVGFKLQDAVELNGFGSIGYSAGALVGYNRTFANRWLAGVELGGEVSNNSAKASITSGPDFARGKATTDQEATLSGRLGYFVSPTTLLYSSIGVTAVHGKGSYAISQGGLTRGDTQKDIFYGVAFGALGIETQLSGNWRGRFEYVTSLLRSNVYRDGFKVEVSPQIGTARLALVYGFGGTSTSAKAADPAPTWTGFYLGGGVSRNHSISQYDLSISPAHLSVDGLGATGWSGSALAGYNYQLNNVIVAGAEVVGTLSTSKSRYLLQATPLAPVVSESTGLVGRNREWYSARLRSGYLVSPETMAYGFLGYTRVHSALDAVGMLSLVGQTYNQTYNRQGLEFGGGVESWVTKSMTLRVEYGFAQLGKVDLVKNAPMLGTLKHRQSNGMVAVAYHF
jgi:outer membrane immunogenic protein